MPTKPETSAMRAVITELEDGFLVSISTIEPDKDPTILCDEEVATIDAAHALVEDTARQFGWPPKGVKKLYNLSTGISSKPPKSTKRVNKT